MSRWGGMTVFKLSVVRFLALALVVSAATLMVPVSTSAHTGTNGCTPGYWKNHTSSWPSGYLPNNLVTAYFPAAGAYVGTATLIQALDFGGGSGTDGAARILLRAGVAALLNSASGFYPFTVSQVQTAVNNALASGNRATMLSVAGQADGFNNLGCPLN
ncbi:MAG: hypothetical protein QN178_10115 [Armatimonadota bacterium]|nr:hypothetical protein [Armatimonadota bacterium]